MSSKSKIKPSFQYDKSPKLKKEKKEPKPKKQKKDRQWLVKTRCNTDHGMAIAAEKKTTVCFVNHKQTNQPQQADSLNAFKPNRLQIVPSASRWKPSSLQQWTNSSLVIVESYRRQQCYDGTAASMDLLIVVIERLLLQQVSRAAQPIASFSWLSKRTVLDSP